MIDREKRRKIIRKLVAFWFEHNLAIAVVLVAVFVGTLITVLYVCLSGGNDIESVVDSNEHSDYSSILDMSKPANNKRKNKTQTASGADQYSQEYEYQTVLQYNSSTKDGYMNNCIFLGDSRTVAMVSYGFVSDENVLAKVGISHPSVLKSTFMQNSGKEFTLDKYLETHKAPVIYIGFGVNGMSGGADEKYEKSYKEMIEHIMEKAPESEIVIMAIWPVDDYGPYKNTCQNSWIDKYNDFLKTLAEYEGIYYLDVDSALKTDKGQIRPEYDAGDGLHYRACAYTTILEYIIHHPVPGIPDDGEFVVKYVKPTGQFKKMMKETATLPPNVQVVDEQAEGQNPDEQLDAEVKPTIVITPTIEVKPTIVITPTIEVKPTIETKPTVEVKPTVEAGPTVEPQPTPEPPKTDDNNDNQDGEDEEEQDIETLLSLTPKPPEPEITEGVEERKPESEDSNPEQTPQAE